MVHAHRAIQDLRGDSSAFRVGFSGANPAWCVTFLPHEVITQKKLPHIPGAPHAVHLLFRSRAPPGASGFVPAPNVANEARSTVKSAGRNQRKTSPTTPGRSPPIACGTGANLIPVIGGVAPMSAASRPRNGMTCGPYLWSLRYEIPAMRYQIPGLRNSLPLLGSSRGWVAMRYKTPSRETCARS